jgi:hypothetical protein
MQREKIIEALVVDCLVSIFDRNRYCWLQGILENGFRGFAQMSTQELLLELKHRGLDISSSADCAGDIDMEDCDAGHHELLALHASLNREEV